MARCPYCLQTFEEKGKGLVSSHQCGEYKPAPAPTILGEITANLTASMGAGRDDIILTAIRNVSKTDAVLMEAIRNKCLMGLTSADISEIRSRGHFETYPDKTEIFFWDGKPLVKFQPMEIHHEGGKITASQPYQLL